MYTINLTAAQVKYQNQIVTTSEAVNRGWLDSLVYENATWQTLDIRNGSFKSGGSYWIYALIDNVTLTLVGLDQQAQQGMIRRATHDSRFGIAIIETFGKNLNWPGYPDWELRWMNFNFTGDRTVTIYHATYKPDASVRYTIFLDPDTNQWSGWTQVFP